MSTTLHEIKNRKFKFLRRGALQHGSLHMSKLSTFDALQLSISSYRLKTFYHRPKVLFEFCEKWWKMTKLNFWNEDFFGMCSYTLVRTFRMTFETFFNFFIWSKTPFLTFGTQKTRKIKFLERGVLWDEFLHM